MTKETEKVHKFFLPITLGVLTTIASGLVSFAVYSFKAGAEYQEVKKDITDLKGKVGGNSTSNGALLKQLKKQNRSICLLALKLTDDRSTQIEICADTE